MLLCSNTYAARKGGIINPNLPSIKLWDDNYTYYSSTCLRYADLSTAERKGKYLYISAPFVKKGDNIIMGVDYIEIKELSDHEIVLIDRNTSPTDVVDLNSRETAADRPVRTLYKLINYALRVGPAKFKEPPLDLKKSWQADVDAASLTDGVIMTLYHGMPAMDFRRNFYEWRNGEFKQYLYYDIISKERGDDSLKEIISVTQDHNKNIVYDPTIKFETNQRELANQIFERFRSNFERMYRNSDYRKGNGYVQYTYVNGKPGYIGYLRYEADFIKEKYIVSWTGMMLCD